MNSEITGDYVLQMAQRIEHNGADFYMLAAEQAPEMAQPLLQGLAQQELEHEQQFAQLRESLAQTEANQIDPDGEEATFIQGLLEGRFFDPQAVPADYFTGGETFRDILLTAIRLEKESIAFYEGLKAILTDTKALLVVELIIVAEKRHVGELARHLDLLDH